MTRYKPAHYNSLSAYLIADDAQQLIDQLVALFNIKPLRRFDRENGTIAHSEWQVDDTVLMISDSVEGYPAQKAMLHLYVADVHKIFAMAADLGFQVMEAPVQHPGDPDIRGALSDRAGNYWAVSQQVNSQGV